MALKNLKLRFFEKRSQVEIVGLLIIIMMISFILLFALSSFLKKDDNDIKDSYKSKTIASSMISALLRTTTDCNDNHDDMSKLLEDCAMWKSSEFEGNILCKNEQNSCEFFENKTLFMLNKTMNTWQNSFELIITEPDGDVLENETWIIHIIGGNLSNSQAGSASIQPYPLYGGQQDLYIKLCIGGC